MNRYVVISGLPASGKSTLAAMLAAKLELTLIDKDDLLESLFESEGVGDAQWRRKLSQIADREFRKQATEANGAILTSWWRHPRSLSDSGTPTDWLSELPGWVVEVYCRCEASVAASRFIGRTRHPGHLDGRWTYPILLEDFERHASLGPLGFSPVIEVRTDEPPEPDRIVSRVIWAFETPPDDLP